MTNSQSQAIWELCRQGLHLPANEAERNWDHGKPYWLDRYLQVPRRLTALIDRCNWEITTGATGRARAVQEVFKTPRPSTSQP